MDCLHPDLDNILVFDLLRNMQFLNNVILNQGIIPQE
jgi:hypothetical protein